MIRRMVVKVGTSSLTDGGDRLSQEKMAHIAKLLSQVYARSCQVILVSSGAVAAGIGALGWRRGSLSIPEKQAAAAVGQALLMQAYREALNPYDIIPAQLLLISSDLEDRPRFVHMRNTLETLLRHGVLPVVNENDTVAVDEIRVGDNDTLASRVALATSADLLLLLTDIDGLYTADPRSDPNATRMTFIQGFPDSLWQLAGGSGTAGGTGGMVTKLKAAQIALQSGIACVIASSTEPDVIARVQEGADVGTMFVPSGKKRSDKRAWLLSRSRVDGALVIDGGAVTALLGASGSLLFPGVVSVQGAFEEGAIVDIVDAKGRLVGRGSVNFSAHDLNLLLHRRHAGETSRVTEVIHRNELAVLAYESGE